MAEKNPFFKTVQKSNPVHNYCLMILKNSDIKSCYSETLGLTHENSMVLHVGSDVLRGGGPARRAHGQPQHHRLQPIHQGLTTPQIIFFSTEVHQSLSSWAY